MRQSKISWQEVPTLRFVLPLLFGGAIYLWFPHGTISPYFLLACGLSLLLSHRYRSLWPYLFYPMIGVLGYSCFQLADQVYNGSIQIEEDVAYRQQLVVEEVQWDAKKKRWRGMGQTLIADSIRKKVKVYYWIERREGSQELSSGDTLTGSFSLRPPLPPKIPGDFDFGSYLRKKNIAYTIYIPSFVDYTHDKGTTNSLSQGLNEWRAEKIESLNSYTDSITQSLLRAILFGDTRDLDPELRRQFADAGMAHILAVSGMHVGLLVWISQFLILRFFPRRKWREAVQLIIILLLVWLYVALCQFAASATRAALMVSIYFIGRYCKCPATGLNTLGLSALILFLWNPFVLLDLGAQLSFAAMIGIILTQKFWQDLFLRISFLPESLTTLMALSFAAQMGVGPLLLYHFGSFPLLFWLFSVPAAYLAVFLFIGGWSLVFTGSISSWMAGIIGSVISWGNQSWMNIMEILGSEGLPTMNWEYFPLSFLFFLFLLVGMGVRLLYISNKTAFFRQLHLITIAATAFILLTQYEKTKTEVRQLNLPEDKVCTLIKVGPQLTVIDHVGRDKKGEELKNWNVLKQAYPVDTVHHINVLDVSKYTSDSRTAEILN